MIRKALEKDLCGIAKVHSEALAETIVSRMGVSILEKLYAALLRQDNATIYVSEEKGEISGVASWALSYKIDLDKDVQGDIARKVVANPRSWLGVIERSLTGQYIKLFFGYEPWLLTLAVVTNKQRKGSGTRLVEKVFEDVRRHGQSSLLVETLLVKKNVINFYEKLGFVRVKKIGPNIILRKSL